MPNTSRRNHFEDRPPISRTPGTDASVEETAVWLDDWMKAGMGAPDSETARFLNEGIGALRPLDEGKSWRRRIGLLLRIILVAGLGFLLGQNSPDVVENDRIAGAIEAVQSRVGSDLDLSSGGEDVVFALDLKALGDFVEPVRGTFYQLSTDAYEAFRQRAIGLGQGPNETAESQLENAYIIENAYELDGLETLEARVTGTDGGGITSSGQPYDPAAHTVAVNMELFDERDRLVLMSSLTRRAIVVTVNDHIRRGDIAVTPAAADKLGFEGKTDLVVLRFPHAPDERARARLAELGALNADLQSISGQSEMPESSAVQNHAAGDTTLD